MSGTTDIDYQNLRDALAAAGAVDEPAEVHGTLCGALCVDETVSPLALVEAEADADLRDTLAELRRKTLEGLFDPELGFAPLLPDDEVALERRVQALARWCGGFVYGIASRGEFDFLAVSEEVREVVHDLTDLSKAALTAEDPGGEGGEADYAELVEYLRVGVQLVFLELRSGRAADPAARLH